MLYDAIQNFTIILLLWLLAILVAATRRMCGCTFIFDLVRFSFGGTFHSLLEGAVDVAVRV